MKENSIEENIEVIESIIEEYENCCVPEIDMQVNVTFREKQNNALNHILLDYKRALKENERLQKENEELGKFITEGIEIKTNSPYKDYSLEFLRNNFIPVQKVKDKIEEYKNILKTCNKVKDIDRIKAINERILELQELLEGRR